MQVEISVKEAINIMVERIASQFDPERIILFGSQARSDARTDSDIDLLVVMNNCNNRKVTTISIMKALSDLPFSKDILVTTLNELNTRGKLMCTVLYPALHEGTVLYARSCNNERNCTLA